MNIWLHIAFFTSAPPFFKLADAAGLLSPNNVWINSELVTWGDTLRISQGPYPNHGIPIADSVDRIYGMLQVSETWGTDAGWSRYHDAFTDPSNERDDCACSSTGDAIANCAFNHTSYPGGGLEALPGTVSGTWTSPEAPGFTFAGMWAHPGVLSAPYYDCVVALAAAFANSSFTDGSWDGEEVITNMARLDDFNGASGTPTRSEHRLVAPRDSSLIRSTHAAGTVRLDSSANREADDSYKYREFREPPHHHPPHRYHDLHAPAHLSVHTACSQVLGLQLATLGRLDHLHARRLHRSAPSPSHCYPASFHDASHPPRRARVQARPTRHHARTSRTRSSET